MLFLSFIEFLLITLILIRCVSHVVQINSALQGKLSFRDILNFARARIAYFQDFCMDWKRKTAVVWRRGNKNLQQTWFINNVWHSLLGQSKPLLSISIFIVSRWILLISSRDSTWTMSRLRLLSSLSWSSTMESLQSQWPHLNLTTKGSSHWAQQHQIRTLFKVACMRDTRIQSCRPSVYASISVSSLSLIVLACICVTIHAAPTSTCNVIRYG